MTEKIALVGTPCEMLTAAKLQHYTQSPIEYKIGLFCMENFSYSYLSNLMSQYDVDYDDIKKFRIEKGFGFLTLNDDSQIKIPISDLQDVVRKNCNICVDLTSEKADISIGSIGSADGYSRVIIRNEKLDEIIQKAIDDGYFEVKLLSEKQEKILKRLSSNKKKRNLENIEEKESRSKPVLYMRDVEMSHILDENMVSNFADLEANVIDNASCVHCGGCEYMCPYDLIKIDDTKPFTTKKCPDDCHACFIICPRTYTPDKLKFDNKKAIGEYTSIMSLKSLKDYPTQDGGVITTLLEYLMENEYVDKTVIVDKKEDQPWKPYAKLTDDINDVIAASGTKYSVCPVFKPLKELKEEGK